MVKANKKHPFEYINDRIDIDAWLLHVQNDYPLITTDLLQKTCLLLEQHYPHSTCYGKPRLLHGIAISEQLLALGLDSATAAVGILIPYLSTSWIHIADTDTQHNLTNTATTAEQCQPNAQLLDWQEQLGHHVAQLIDGVKRMQAITQLQLRTIQHIDQIRKMFLAMAADIRVVLIKLAERACLMQAIKELEPTLRTAIAQETLDIYAPLANRLGIGQLKWELEDLSLRYIAPDIYKKIADFLAERREDREERIQTIIQELKSHLVQQGITATISGRAKHIYSIYAKLKRKGLGYNDIYDYSAIRMLVPSIEDCYTCLSVVHSLWTPIIKEFDDYIASPKPNGYQSIHTAVVLPSEKTLEIQIRTDTMHEAAECGVAAHWLYKENKSDLAGYEAKIIYLRQLLDWQRDIATQSTPKIYQHIVEDRIYVLSPLGDIIDLPAGATPLDFAYLIHTELGHRCRGAKINDHMVPLTYQLQTGDRVEILTTKQGQPSRDWLNPELGYLNSQHARRKVSQWFKQQDFDLPLQTGKTLLEKELQRHGLNNIDLKKAAEKLNFKNEQSMLVSLGRNTLKVGQIMNSVNEPAPINVAPPLPSTHFRNPTPASASGIIIEGVNNLLIRLARCCKPIPGDLIIGYITQGRGIAVHKKTCRNLNRMLLNADHRHIQVDWDHHHNKVYPVDVVINATAQDGIIHHITSLLADMKINLFKLNTITSKRNSIITLTIEIQHLNQLNKLLMELQQLPQVNDAKRLIG